MLVLMTSSLSCRSPSSCLSRNVTCSVDLNFSSHPEVQNTHACTHVMVETLMFFGDDDVCVLMENVSVVMVNVGV